MTDNKKSEQPRISVIVPSFNERPHVLLESLNSLAAQSFEDFECLLVDESTAEVSANACQTFCDRDERFHYVRPPQRIGLPASLNLAIQQARGNLIARFDSDDICLPDRLQSQIDFMDTHQDVGVLGGALELISDGGTILAQRAYPMTHRDIARQFQTTTAVAHPTVMFRRALIERYGGYDPTFKFAEDLDLWLRLLNKGVKFANLPSTLVKYRQQSTARPPDHWVFNLRARLRNFDRAYLGRRLAGIAAIALWRRLPVQMQRRIFATVVLRKQS